MRSLDFAPPASISNLMVFVGFPSMTLRAFDFMRWVQLKMQQITKVSKIPQIMGRSPAHAFHCFLLCWSMVCMM